MAASKTVWGIDIGQCALKAVKLQQVGERFQVDACEIIEHASVLSQPDVDSRALIQTSLDEFLQRHDVTGSVVSVAVLGQSSFTRFVKLPPVEYKKIPEIVRFEAEQQIPFPINEVTWRYQTFQDPDSPEIEAGIFALKKVDVSEMLSFFAPAGLEVDVLQMAPLALYNFMKVDGQYTSDGATLLADVGADKTHLVIVDGGKIWTRTIKIGGNNFTHALCKSFNLNFEKAEKLKRTAAASKYARQIFQVMRPVFANLVQEIQRSIGYYTSINRECRFKKLLGLGCGFLLPGMQKYLEQNLNMHVEQFNTFNSADSNDPNFQARALSFGVAYGLALQGLNAGEVDCNLLPEEILKRRLWSKKKPWFVAAAAAVMVAVGLYAMRGFADYNTLNNVKSQHALGEAQSIVKKLDDWKRESQKIDTNYEQKEEQIAQNLRFRAFSNIWPTINANISAALEQTMFGPNDAKILDAFALGTPQDQAALVGQIQSDQAVLELVGLLPFEQPSDDSTKTATASLRSQLVKKFMSKPRKQRQLLLLAALKSMYVSDLDSVRTGTSSTSAGERGMMMGPGGPGMAGEPGFNNGNQSARNEKAVRGLIVDLELRTPMDKEAADMAQKFKVNLKNTFDANPDLEVHGQIEVKYLTQQTEAGGNVAAGGRSGGFGAGNFEMGGKAATTAKGEDMPPVLVHENDMTDVIIQVRVKLAVVGDGLPKPAKDEENNK
ncbi:MAG TPA: type IV pilus assembly protein PilM [Phycisphaerae bacterium]|nr:type IV pilus assembly protein PilM [Phycisphaerae bacterium]